MDASLLWERHPFFFALKVMRDNLQKKKFKKMQLFAQK